MMEGFAGANLGDPGGPTGGEYEVPPAGPYEQVSDQSFQQQLQPQPQGVPVATQGAQRGQKGQHGTLLLGGLCAAAGLAIGLMLAKRK